MIAVAQKFSNFISGLAIPSLADALDRERERWFLFVPVGIAIGILLYMAMPTEPNRSMLALTPVGVILLLVCRRFLDGITADAVMHLCTVMLVICLGFNAAQIQTIMLATPMLTKPISAAKITGTLLHAEPLPDGTRITLEDVRFEKPQRTSPLPNTVRLRIRQPLDASFPPTGTVISVVSSLNPFSPPLLPGGYDFRQQAFTQGLGATGWTFGKLSTAEVKPPDNLIERISRFFENARRELGFAVARHLTGNEASLTASLLTGSQTGIPRPVLQDWRASGLAHLLSISGVHVSMVGLLFFVPLRFLLALVPWIALRLPIKKIAAIGAVLATAVYTLLVGLQTPTMRSALMTGLIMLAIITDRMALGMRMIALSASAVMLIMPGSIMGPSFQMSFAAVIALVAAFERKIDDGQREGADFFPEGWLMRIVKFIAALALTSVIATVATLPFALWHFQNISVWGVVSNMIAVPLTDVWIMPCLLLAYILFPFGLEGWALQLAGLGVRQLDILAHNIAQWPWARISVPAMPSVAFGMCVVGGLWLCLWRARWRFLGVLPFIAGLISLFFVTPPDLIIAESGSFWAVRLADGRMVVPDMNGDKFSLEQWQQRIGMPQVVTASDITTARNNNVITSKSEPTTMEQDNQRLRCDDLGCIFRRGGAVVALPTVAEALEEDCTRATMVLAPWKVAACGNNAPSVISRDVLNGTGTQMLWFSDDISQSAPSSVKTVRNAGVRRPWT